MVEPILKSFTETLSCTVPQETYLEIKAIQESKKRQSDGKLLPMSRVVNYLIKLGLKQYSKINESKVTPSVQEQSHTQTQQYYEQ